MSFGFSVGDILAGAQLAYTLGKALSDTKGASSDYQELISQLHVVHKVLIQVDQLRAANQLAQATINALLFTINSASEAIEKFLTQYENYEESLRQGGSGKILKDVYKKGKWATQMPDKVRDLKGTLATMLAAINCLVSLACYYNTGYDRFTAAIYPDYDKEQQGHDDTSWGKDIKLTAKMFRDFHNLTACPGFNKQGAPEYFFRPGQIFSAQITSSWSLQSHRGFRKVDFGNLPLEPVSTLKEKAIAETIEDRGKRLAQIWGLPLERMVQYCESSRQDPTKVICLLCRTKLRAQDARQDATPCPKDDWASCHFRVHHWEYYLSMLPREVSEGLEMDMRVKLVPPESLASPIPGSSFSKEAWINLTHVVDPTPIMTDQELIGRFNVSSWFDDYLRGPVLIQRFVVVRQGVDRCLCLGIHTYSRRGCGDQPDQELFGILHSSEEPPPPMANETGMVLAPVRMKSDHPSTALSRTARIHYGRAYEISHDIPVQSIGLIQDASMEVLLDQFEATVPRRRDEGSGATHNQIPQPQIEAANLDVAKSIREDVATVLGNCMSPAENQPPKKWELLEY
ncbi:hypothetical protein F5Y00DRAFT_268494 [Daldinia vernicosa]|uniref:uncharacterized protein n=1 Tax=Daldinia vernicosa TaxID=114800 RepID=UPI0020082E05|nr:uncharacterized protein F5Y00DRAFT_268494 [Daldinia vernicosa]KAI0850362.1 hypothetical protein F5Y00DRAFT_268494 [Daldinia vernicosa]